ncbi:TPA: hypothetical protein ACRTOB_001991 [Aeromonas hydrophila]
MARSQSLSDGIVVTANRISTIYSSDGTSIGTNATLTLCESGQPQVNLVIAQSGRSTNTPQANICP